MKSDISLTHPSASSVLEATQHGMRDLLSGRIISPQKIYSRLGNSGIAISMLASRPDDGVSLVKTYFETSVDSAHKGRSFSSFQMFREDEHLPSSNFPDDWITTARSSATTCLFIRKIAQFRSGKVVIVGLGNLGCDLLNFLPLVCPDNIQIVGLARSSVSAERFERMAEDAGLTANCETVVGKTEAKPHLAEADIIIATAGHGGIGFIDQDDISPGTLLVYVGYGFSKTLFDQADRLYTTSQEQMNITCPEFQNDDGSVRIADQDLNVLLDETPIARVGPEEYVMAYNSGLAACDLTVAELGLRY